MYKREKEVYEYLLDNEESAIKALERHYIAALDDVRLCIRMMQADEQTQSVIHRINYQKKLEKQLEGIVEKLHMAEYKTIKQYLESSYTDAFVGTMYTLHGQDVPIIAPIDQNAAIKAIQLDTKLTDRKIHASATGELVTLYESLGVDADKLKKVARSEITRGIASGMLYDDIARNVSNTTKAPLSRAKTIVRTEGHRIQQQSAEDARQAAKARGADVVKQWDSTLDGDTRPTHRALDGQIKKTNEPFVLGTKKAMHPGDFGDPAEDCNCRCVALTRARKALDAAELATMKERAKFFGLAEDEDKKQTFAEFEKKYLKAAKNPANTTKPLKSQGKSGIIDPGGTLDKFDRKVQVTSWEPDLKAANPHYSLGVEYKQNCQRCIPAYELRRRGYNVQAKPAVVTPSGKISSKDPLVRNGKWMDGIFSNIQWKRVWSGAGITEIENAMATWGDGARAEVYVVWKNGGAHVFIAERINGQTHFFDPQSGSSDFRNKFAGVKSGYTMFARIDNLSVLDAIEDCVENVR